MGILFFFSTCCHFTTHSVLGSNTFLPPLPVGKHLERVAASAAIGFLILDTMDSMLEEVEAYSIKSNGQMYHIESIRVYYGK